MKLDEFLLTRIAEDEAAARAAHYEGQRWLSEEEDVLRWPDDDLVHVADRKRDAAHIARHGPARVLAECAAKRAIVKLHAHVEGCGCLHNDQGLRFGCCICHEDQGYILSAGWCDTLLALARVYADHPDLEDG